MSDAYIVVRCIGHKSIKLRRGDTLRIGRHHTNDLVLNDGTVSRFHCSLEWDRDEDRPWLVDNNSANGVEVDGAEVDGKHYLLGNNQIGIGDFTVVLQLKGPKAVTQAYARPEAKDRQHLIDDEGDTVVRLFSESKRALRGTFTDNLELQRLLIDLEASQRTGTLMVKDGARQIKLMFGNGLLITAVRGTDSGRPVLQHLLRLSGGSYRFGPEVEPSETSLNLSIRDFLEEEGDQTMRFERSPLDD